MTERNIVVSNRLGLHARAAAKVVKAASEFESEIWLLSEDRTAEANAKSILSLLALAAGKGTGLIIVAKGADEHEAVKKVAQLFENKFGEEE